MFFSSIRPATCATVKMYKNLLIMKQNGPITTDQLCRLSLVDPSITISVQ